jgi:hypothetical protein
MLWILNKELLNDNFIFYQIFNPNNISNCNNNIIYNLENNIISQDFTDYKNIKINYEIKIMGNIIMYKKLKEIDEIDDNEILTFIKKETYDLSNNLILTYEYKLVDNTRLPELTSYDFHYKNMEFNIYYKNYDKLFIMQKNKSNNSSTNYWIQSIL